MKKKTIIISSVILVFVAIVSVVTFVVNKDEARETSIPSTQEAYKSTNTSTTPHSETESTNETTTLVTTTTKKASVTKFEPTTKKASAIKESTTKKQPSSSGPNFEYISKVTGYDGRIYYKVFDEENNRYYYTDNTGRKYAEEYVLQQIRPTAEEIKANPISKVTLYGVTWYKYKTGSGSTRYLASDGRDCTRIEVNVQTYGKESVTIDGVTFYKTRINGQYEYVDSQGNCLEYDNSYCHQCGSPDCTPSLNSYYCVICKKTIAGSECHPKTHFYESH